MVKFRTAVIIAAITAAGPVWSESARMKEGRRVYEANCAACHDSGADGAPAIGKPGEWKTRSGLWEAILFEHANKGYLAMPAKGGDAQLSEYEVDVASEYMLNLVHPDLPRD